MLKMRPDFLLIFTLLSVLSLGFLGSGCQQKMLKATPFLFGSHPQAIGDSEDRVNLWPLVYHRDPATSILWPIGEMTDEGWALRPLYAQYAGKYDILWPFIHLEPENGSGYVFPLIYWGDDYFLFLPLLGWGGDKYDGGYFSPFLAQTWNPNEYQVILPLLMTWWGKDGDEKSNFFTPLYGRSVGPNYDRSISLPLLTMWATEGEGNSYFVNPLFSKFNYPEEDHTSFPALLTFWGNEGEDQNYFISPLFSRVEDRDEDFNLLTPLLTVWGKEEGDGSFFFTPLYYQKREKDGTKFDVLPLFLSWNHRNQSKDLSSTHLLFSLFGYSHRPSVKERHFFPFYFHKNVDRNGSTAGSYFFLNPFYGKIEHSEDHQTHFLPFMLSAVNDYEDQGSFWHLFLSTIAWGSFENVEGETVERLSRLFPLYSYRRDQSKRRLSLPFLLYTQIWDTEYESNMVNFGWFLGHWQDRPGYSSGHLLGIYNSSHQTYVYDDLPEDALTPPAENITQLEQQEVNQLPGFESRVLEKGRLDIWPLFYDHEKRVYENGDDYELSRVFWRLYHDERLNDERTVDIFPFFTYDSVGEEKTSWSWFVKFLRYERKKDSGSFHFLFIPIFSWGDDD